MNVVEIISLVVSLFAIGISLLNYYLVSDHAEFLHRMHREIEHLKIDFEHLEYRPRAEKLLEEYNKLTEGHKSVLSCKYEGGKIVAVAYACWTTYTLDEFEHQKICPLRISKLEQEKKALEFDLVDSHIQNNLLNHGINRLPIPDLGPVSVPNSRKKRQQKKGP